MIGALFQRVALLSLSCSAVLLPLLLLAGPIQRRYRAQSCAVLWLLLAVRLLLPVRAPLELLRPAVTLPVPEYTVVMPPRAQEESAPAALAPAAPSVGGRPPAAAKKVPARSAAERLGTVWLLGAAVFLLGQGAVCRLARRRLMRGAREDAEDRACVERLRRELGVRWNAGVWRTARAATPLTLGLLRPVILLPEQALPAEHLELILRHELLHIRRGDLWYKALLLTVNAVHWFNPLVWWMAREAGRNLEYCCDDAVVRGRDADFRRRYGAVLLHAAGGGGPALCTRFGDSGTRLKGRLMNLFQTKRTGAAMVCLVLAGAVLAGGLVACESAGAAGSGDPTASPPPPAPTQTAQAGKDLVLEGVAVNDSAAVLARAYEAVYGVDMPRIDYASEQWVVFHDYWGLAVYDRASGGIVGAADTPALGLNRIQGDQYTDVQVSADAQAVRLENVPNSDGTCWTYLWEEDLFQTGVAESFEAAADPLGDDPEEEARVRGVEPAGAASNFALLPDGTLLYLLLPEGSSGLIREILLAEVDPQGQVTTRELFPTAGAENGCQWPVPEEFRISALIGSRVHPVTGAKSEHSGVDIAAREGTPVLAALNGVVAASGFDASYGNYVELTHEDGLSTLYAQLSTRKVEEGDTVDRGQVIGAVGATGASTGAHLHLEFRVNGEPADPLAYYPSLEVQYS